MISCGAARIFAGRTGCSRKTRALLVPCNDFSFYDHVLDMSLAVGAVPERYNAITQNPRNTELDLYFAMARGHQKDGLDLIAMEMTKWFDTNYHYLVPEFHKGQPFKLASGKIIDEFRETQALVGRVVDKSAASG